MAEVLEKEIHILGASISQGVSTGVLCFIEDFIDDGIPEFPIESADIEGEIERYRKAVCSSRKDLYDLQCFLAKKGGSQEAASIIDTHIQMLEDPFMTTFVEKKIRQMLKNTEAVFWSVMTEYEKEFSKVKDSFFKQRLLDVKDLSQRILRHLNPKPEISLKELPKGSIIFTRELIPSLTAEATAIEIGGFISEVGGATSHAALIAKSKGIPYIVDVKVEQLKQYEKSRAIIDGVHGKLIIHPSKKTSTAYQAYSCEQKIPVCHGTKKDKRVKTIDGCELEFLANIESIKDLDLLNIYGAAGVGLFRSEFLFFGKELRSFSEEEQCDIYKKVMKNSRDLPLIFRIFDVGGDKGNLDLEKPELNPALGCRAIRFLLRNRNIFVMQLRALLKVSLEGKLRILLPLISDISELIETKQLIQEVAIELRKEGITIADEIPIGSMIEVPSAVMICDLIAEECDFLSLGTNDLTQYTLAMDRTHQDMHSFYKFTHPSIIRMIYQVAKVGHQKNIPVSLCGEMASDPLMIPLLLGLGIRTFSCAPRYIPLIKAMARRVSLKECEGLIEEVFALNTCDAVEKLLQEKFEKDIIQISHSIKAKAQ